jgi:peptidyl-prolyl cis-trans isomerase C
MPFELTRKGVTMDFKKLTISLASLTLIAACGKSGPTGSSDLEGKLKGGKELASRDGVEVHEGYLELLEGINPNISMQLNSPAGKKRLVDNLLEQEILYREAMKQGIQNNPKYQEKAAVYERVILAQGLIEEEIDKRAKKYYDDNKEDEFSQVKIAHILFRTRRPNPMKKGDKGVNDAEAMAKAKEAKKKLDEGVAWEEVVTEYSDDRLTKAKGGELGKIGRKDRRAVRLQWNDIIDQAFKMKAGDISDPIKARDGIHIIKVVEASSIAPYEEVENRIKFKLRGPVKNEVLKEIVGDSETVYLDEELKKIPTPGTFPPGGLPGAPGGAPQMKVKAKTEKPAAAPPSKKQEKAKAEDQGDKSDNS